VTPVFGRDGLTLLDHHRLYNTGGTGVSSAGGDGGREPVWGRIANAKIFGWVIYAAGFAVWLFGYLSAGHAPLFDWNAATPWWVSSFVPNFEAELGLALMYASMIPIYGGAVRKRAFAYTALLVFGAVTLAWWWFLAWLFWNAI
jgi:hypothetical protein